MRNLILSALTAFVLALGCIAFTTKNSNATTVSSPCKATGCDSCFCSEGSINPPCPSVQICVSDCDHKKKRVQFSNISCCTGSNNNCHRITATWELWECQCLPPCSSSPAQATCEKLVNVANTGITCICPPS